MRRISDGSRLEVLKNFPDEDEFMALITPFGEDFWFRELEYFWLAQYGLKTGAEQNLPAKGTCK